MLENIPPAGVRGLRAALLALALAAPCRADTIYLTNGNQIDGIVTSQTKDKIEIEFGYQGYITFPRSQILEVVRDSAAGNAQLRQDWKDQHADFSDQSQGDQDSQAEQGPKGLVLYKGQWVPQDQVPAADADEDAQAPEDQQQQPAAAPAAGAADAAANNGNTTGLRVVYVGPPMKKQPRVHERRTEPRPRKPERPPFMVIRERPLESVQNQSRLSLIPSVSGQGSYYSPRSNGGAAAVPREHEHKEKGKP